MSLSKPTVSSVQDFDLITKRKEDDLKTDSIESRNIQLDVTDLLEIQGPTGGT